MPERTTLNEALREIGQNPFLFDRVDHPFENCPSDLRSFNRRAFELIKREIFQVRNSKDKKCRGVLVLGEAGSGKTHLLNRLHHDLAQENHMLFVRRATNADAILYHIWGQVLESLTRPIPGEIGTTQSDLLLREAFSTMLQESLAEDEEQLAGKTKGEWDRIVHGVRSGEP